MPDKYNPFKFNILPPKPKQEVELIEERNDSVLYAIVLIFIISIVYFIIILVQGLVIDPRLAEAGSALQSRLSAIETYSPIQSVNGELFVKTKNLKPVLDRKIEAGEIFRIGEAISALPNVEVQSYGRERTGQFVFRVVTPNFDLVSVMVAVTKEIPGTANVYVRSVSLDQDNSIYVTTIVLDIIATDADAA